ncbi:MAG: hypothetical protein ABSA62_12465, partial [Methyloceanibacter sp.]
MNPLLWRREHQIALLVAAGIGCILGITIGYAISDYDGFHPFWVYLVGGWCCHSIQVYDGRSLISGLLGAITGGAIVYIRQLLR